MCPAAPRCAQRLGSPHGIHDPAAPCEGHAARSPAGRQGAPWPPSSISSSPHLSKPCRLGYGPFLSSHRPSPGPVPSSRGVGTGCLAALKSTRSAHVPERRSVFQARCGGPPEPPLAGGVLLRGLQHLHACPEPLETGESRQAGRARGCQHTRWRCSDSPVGRSPCRCTVRSVVSGPREAAAQTFSRGAEITPSADRGNWRFLGQDGFTDGGKCPVLGSGCWALGAGHPLTLKTRSLTTCRQPWRVSHPPPLGSDKCPRHWVSWGLPFPGAAGLVATFLQVTRGKRATPECPSPSRAAHGVLARGQEE